MSGRSVADSDDPGLSACFVELEGGDFAAGFRRYCPSILTRDGVLQRAAQLEIAGNIVAMECLMDIAIDLAMEGVV